MFAWSLEKCRGSVRLVVIDRYHAQLQDAVEGGGNTLLLALGFPSQVLIDAARNRGYDISPEVFLTVAPFAQNAKRVLREFVPRFYAGLPLHKDESGRSLAEVLFADDADAWWLTDVSEKSIFRGKLIARLYNLALVREAFEACRPTEVWIGLADSRLSDLLAETFARHCNVRRLGGRARLARPRRALSNAAASVVQPARAFILAWSTLAEFLVVKALTFGCAARDESRVGPRLALFSFFPVWWRNAWDAERRREVFYQGSIKGLAESGFVPRYIVWLRLGLVGLLANMAKLRRSCRQGEFRYLQSFCKAWSGVKRVGVIAPLYTWRALRLRPVDAGMMFAGFQITALVHEEVLQSVGRRELFRNLLLREAVARLPAHDLLLFRIEFQPFERAILLGLKNRTTVTAGYQHSSVGKDYLSHLFAPDELRHGGLPGARQPPMPDHIITTGEYVAELMLENGFAAERVHVAGPLRYQALRRRLHEGRRSQARQDENGRYRLLVPVSLDKHEAIGLAAVLAQALLGAEQRFVLCIKGHPANDHSKEFSTYLRRKAGAARIHLVPRDADLYEYIGTAKALVMTGSTVGLEAIALGTPVVMFSNDHIFSFTASSLNAVGPAIINVSDVLGMKQALERLYTEETPFLEARPFWPQAVKAMFHDFEKDPEARFCEIVREILVGSRNTARAPVKSVL